MRKFANVDQASDVLEVTKADDEAQSHNAAGGYVIMSALQVTASIASRDGGPSTAITSMNNALRTLGSKSLILSTLADGKRASLNYGTSTTITHLDAAVWFSKRNRPFALKNSWQLGLRTIRLANRADVLHIHGVYLSNSIYAYLASILTDTPYVVQPHGTLEPYQQRTGRLRKAIFNRLIGHRIMRSASGVITASASEAQNIEEQYPGLALHVIPLGVSDDEPRRPAVAAGAERWLKAPQHQRVIFLGRLANKKRPDLLMQAWSRSEAPGELLVVGPEQDWSEASLRELASAEANTRITFLPALDRAGVAWALAEAGTFVLPSENENFGIAVAEAMFHGCAIVSTTQTASTEHVTAAECGVVLTDTTAESVMDALTIFMGDEDLTRDCGRSAATYARENLTWMVTAEKLQGVYNELAKKKPIVDLTT